MTEKMTEKVPEIISNEKETAKTQAYTQMQKQQATAQAYAQAQVQNNNLSRFMKQNPMEISSMVISKKIDGKMRKVKVIFNNEQITETIID
jgi:hypothetical protein